jgi:hypothetical protein
MVHGDQAREKRQLSEIRVLSGTSRGAHMRTRIGGGLSCGCLNRFTGGDKAACGTPAGMRLAAVTGTCTSGW